MTARDFVPPAERSSPTGIAAAATRKSLIRDLRHLPICLKIKRRIVTLIYLLNACLQKIM
jgi:hypothetical protein